MQREQCVRASAWRPFAVVAWWSLLSACLGQGMIPFNVPAPAYDDNQFVNVLPALRTARAPEWVRPGARVTYYSSMASGSSRRPQGGHGFTQVTVAALNPNAAVLDVQSYGLQGIPTTSPVLQIASDSVVSVPGAGGDWWLSPAVLQQVQDGVYEQTRVIRMPYTVGGRTYNALRFQYESWGARIVYVYDLASGVLLHSNTATGGHHGRPVQTQNTYVGLRYVKTPWAAAGGRWPGNFNALGYSGRVLVVVPGATPVAMPLTAQVQINARGPDWARYTLATSFSAAPGMPPSTASFRRVSGLGHFSSIWVPPAALNALRGGQVLDQDPVTKVTTSVSYVGQGATGGREVVISEVNQVQRLDYAYDAASGLLVGFSKADSPLYMRTQMRLTGRQ